MTKDKNWRYESWATNRPSTSKEEKKKILKSIYDKPAASSKRLASTNTEPFYSDDYLDLMAPPEELEDIKKQLNVSSMVKLRRKRLDDLVLRSAKEKIKKSNQGLPNILMASYDPNKPPTLEDYIRLGLELSQLSESERESIQFMLDKLQEKK